MILFQYKRWIFTFILTLLFFTLVACDESDISIKDNSVIATSGVDLSNYPIGVQNGKVSAELYDLVLDSLSMNMKYSLDIVKVYDDSSDLTDAQNQEIIEISNDYLTYLKSVKYEPKNEIEKEISEQLSWVTFEAKQIAKSNIGLANGDNTYQGVLGNQIDRLSIKMDDLNVILEKYKLIN